MPFAASACSGLWSLCDSFCQFPQEGVHLGVGAFDILYLAAGVHNGGMVSAAQMAANFLEAVLGQISGQVHANLAGLSNTLTAFLALQIGKSDVKMVGYRFDNICDAYMPRRQANLSVQGCLSQFKCNLLAGGGC